MARQLTKKNEAKSTGSVLTNNKDKKFMICISEPLDNKFNFKKLNPEAIKSFQRFVDKTVGENLTISKVEQLYLRTKGKPKRIEMVNGVKREIYHFGKDMNPFRIFGYYKVDGYFNITKIDPNHKFDK